MRLRELEPIPMPPAPPACDWEAHLESLKTPRPP